MSGADSGDVLAQRDCGSGAGVRQIEQCAFRPKVWESPLVDGILYITVRSSERLQNRESRNTIVRGKRRDFSGPGTTLILFNSLWNSFLQTADVSLLVLVIPLSIEFFLWPYFHRLAPY